MVDANNRGWNDSNIVLRKPTMESKMFHVLNSKLVHKKICNNYKSMLNGLKRKTVLFMYLRALVLALSGTQ